MGQFASRVTGSMKTYAPLRPSEEDFTAAIDELGKVTSLLAERFSASCAAVQKWYFYFDIDPPYKYSLVPEDIPLIRALKGMSSTEVGRKFEVAPRTIRDVWNGVTWGHINESSI